MLAAKQLQTSKMPVALMQHSIHMYMHMCQVFAPSTDGN
jgi:hypothetical protein